jgi:hypothetical protein
MKSLESSRLGVRKLLMLAVLANLLFFCSLALGARGAESPIGTAFLPTTVSAAESCNTETDSGGCPQTRTVGSVSPPSCTWVQYRVAHVTAWGCLTGDGMPSGCDWSDYQVLINYYSGDPSSGGTHLGSATLTNPSNVGEFNGDICFGYSGAIPDYFVATMVAVSGGCSTFPIRYGIEELTIRYCCDDQSCE